MLPKRTFKHIDFGHTPATQLRRNNLPTILLPKRVPMDFSPEDQNIGAQYDETLPDDVERGVAVFGLPFELEELSPLSQYEDKARSVLLDASCADAEPKTFAAGASYAASSSIFALNGEDVAPMLVR